MPKVLDDRLVDNFVAESGSFQIVDRPGGGRVVVVSITGVLVSVDGTRLSVETRSSEFALPAGSTFASLAATMGSDWRALARAVRLARSDKSGGDID